MDDIGKIKPSRESPIQYPDLKAKRHPSDVLVWQIAAGIIIAALVLWAAQEAYREYRLRTAMNQMVKVLEGQTRKPVIQTNQRAQRSNPVRKETEQLIRSTGNAIFAPLCEPGTSFENTPQCYMTPSGKRVHELEGEERQRWIEIAAADLRHKRNQEQLEAAHQETNRKYCAFWQMQQPSERQAEKIAEYCR